MVLFEVLCRLWKRSLYCFLLGSALFGLILSASPEAFKRIDNQPMVEVRYKVGVVDEQAQFDVSFDDDTDLFLVVSSLGDFQQEFSIECSLRRIEKPMLGFLTPLIPLDVKRRLRLGGSLALPENGETLLRVYRDENCRDENSYSRRDKPCGSPGGKHHFFIHVAEGELSDPKQYASVEGIQVGEGKYVRVLLDAQENKKNIANDLVDEIVRIFDEEIVPRSKTLYGQCRDVDGDGKFTILLSPWLNRLSGGKVSLGGFVRSSDFQNRTSPPFGSRCDMMYLNSSLTTGANLKALLAHEYAHAVAFGIRSQNTSVPVEEDWLNEAIAHLSENYHDAGWSNIDHRIDAFLKNTNAFPLVVPDYYHAGLWRNHGCRGATFLFLRWCVDRFGWSLIPRLMQSNSSGVDNISTCVGLPFEELYRRYSISLLQLSDGDSQSVDCYSTLGDYKLRGPNIIDWNIMQHKNQQVVLKGTTTAYLRLPSKFCKGSYRVSLKAQSGTKLQVTLLKTVLKRKRQHRIERLASVLDNG